MASTVSAPGKILWIGGYSVLERPCVSYVTGVDKRVYATVRERGDGKVVLRAPQFKASLEGKFSSQGAIIPIAYAPPSVLDSLSFMLKSAEVSSAVLRSGGVGIAGFEIESKSDAAFGIGAGKAGLGSSAAVTVAAVGAVFEEFGKPVAQNLPLIHKTAQVAHSLAQGKVGSGFDVAASCFGSCRYVRYSPEILKKTSENSPQQIAAAVNSEWDCVIEPEALPPSLHLAIASFEGESSRTSEMVKKTGEWKSSHPKEYSELVGKLDGENKKAIGALENENLADFKRHFAQGRILTKQLGEESGAPIEPDDCTRLIEESERNGAFVAKLPGAGGGDAIAALCLTAGDKKKLEAFWRGYPKKRLAVMDLNVSNAGVRRE